MSVINLNERNKIIQSQKQFWDLLDANVMNNIINLFDNNNKNSANKITKYIEDERIKQGLPSGMKVKTCQVLTFIPDMGY